MHTGCVLNLTIPLLPDFHNNNKLYLFDYFPCKPKIFFNGYLSIGLSIGILDILFVY